VPKDMSSLIESREIRAGVLRKYGFIPTSVLEPDYSWGRHIIEFDKRKQQAVAQLKHQKMDYGDKTSFGEKKEGLSKAELDKTFGMSSQNVRGKTGGLSTFPPALAKFIVEFYSEKGDLILDPCCGHNSRMQVCYELERNYIGYDVSKEFMAFNREVKEQITGKGKQLAMFSPKATITLREQTSEHLEEKDESIDMCFTSPPYFDIEYYGDEPEQLGYNKEYGDFLQGIRSVINECYRVLKIGKYCIFNVNDFRKEGIFYPYHCEIVKLFQNVGFHLHDIIIVKWASSIGACFASQIESRKITSKAHEFLIVGRK